MTERRVSNELLESWRDTLESVQQWNGEEPLLALVESAMHVEHRLSEDEIADLELTTGIEAGQEHETSAN